MTDTERHDAAEEATHRLVMAGHVDPRARDTVRAIIESAIPSDPGLVERIDRLEKYVEEHRREAAEETKCCRKPVELQRFGGE